MSNTQQLKNNIAALRIAIKLIDSNIETRKAQLAYINQHGKVLVDRLDRHKQSITQFDNESFNQSMSPNRSRFIGTLRNSQMSPRKSHQHTLSHSSVIPTVEKSQMEDLEKRVEKLTQTYQQYVNNFEDPILKKLGQNMQRETASLQTTTKECLRLYEKIQRLKMMKDAINKNMPLLSRKKDSIPEDHLEESINKIIVKRGYTSRMMSLIQTG